MKTIVTITGLILFEVSILFAESYEGNLNNFVAPVTPKEATFDDSDGFETLLMSEHLIRILAPSTPKEATFEDIETIGIVFPDPLSLAPVTPKEADFSDPEIPGAVASALPPSPPREADFELISDSI